nr:protein NRT1/ PTR FAMILY 1.1-like [Ipomoea batatas]
MKDLEKESAAKVIRAKKGGMKTMPFVIANETFERVATVGLAANMILYLVNEYHFDNVLGANIMSWWVAISYFTPIFGAFLSDSYLGRSVFFFAFLPHSSSLFYMALLKSARPPPCTQGSENCEKPNSGQLAILFTPLALMAVGAGGIRPCSLAFGADQFDNPDNPNNKRILQTFFNWYYASVGVSIIVAATVIVYIQTEKGWVVGFGVPAVLMLVAAVMFLVGSRLFVKVKPNKSLLTGFYQVVVAAWKNRHLDLPEKGCGDCWYYGEKGSKLSSPSERVSFRSKETMHSEASRRAEISVQSPTIMVHRHNNISNHKPTLIPSATSHNSRQALHRQLPNPPGLILRLQHPHPHNLGRHLRPPPRPPDRQTHQQPPRPRPEATDGDRPGPVMSSHGGRGPGGARAPGQGHPPGAREQAPGPRGHVGDVAYTPELPIRARGGFQCNRANRILLLSVPKEHD